MLKNLYARCCWAVSVMLTRSALVREFGALREGDRESHATASAMSVEPVKLDPLYCGDDYPREGCVIKVLIIKGGFDVSVYAPGHEKFPIEMWGACPTRESLELLVGCLVTGERPPKGFRSVGRTADTRDG